MSDENELRSFAFLRFKKPVNKKKNKLKSSPSKLADKYLENKSMDTKTQNSTLKCDKEENCSKALLADKDSSSKLTDEKCDDKEPKNKEKSKKKKKKASTESSDSNDLSSGENKSKNNNCKKTKSSKVTKESKESRETKESNESKEIIETKETKETRESKESKEGQDSKITKESKEIKETKESIEVKKLKKSKKSKKTSKSDEHGEHFKESKVSKESTESKESKEIKDSNDSIKTTINKKLKELKHSTEIKESKSTKISKESKTSKESKECRETKIPKTNPIYSSEDLSESATCSENSQPMSTRSSMIVSSTNSSTEASPSTTDEGCSDKPQQLYMEASSYEGHYYANDLIKVEDKTNELIKSEKNTQLPVSILFEDSHDQTNSLVNNAAISNDQKKNLLCEFIDPITQLELDRTRGKKT